MPHKQVLNDCTATTQITLQSAIFVDGAIVIETSVFAINVANKVNFCELS